MLKRESKDVPKLGKAKKPKSYPIRYVLLSDIYFYLEDYNHVFNLYSRDQLLNRNYVIFDFDLSMFGSIHEVNIEKRIDKIIDKYKWIRDKIERTISKRDINNVCLKDLIKQIRLLRYLKRCFKNDIIYIWLDCTGA